MRNSSRCIRDWFSPLQRAWSLPDAGAAMGFARGGQAVHARLAGLLPGGEGAGMLAALFPRDRLWRFHLPWIAAFFGVWFAVMLTGVVNPRYRFVFEPFCLFYAGLLLDFLWSGAARLVNLRAQTARGPSFLRLPPIHDLAQIAHHRHPLL